MNGSVIKDITSYLLGQERGLLDGDVDVDTYTKMNIDVDTLVAISY